METIYRKAVVPVCRMFGMVIFGFLSSDFRVGHFKMKIKVEPHSILNAAHKLLLKSYKRFSFLDLVQENILLVSNSGL